eukprot:SAG11_NODE_2442_length_3360_cov_1.445569_1_plen_744_part_10
MAWQVPRVSRALEDKKSRPWRSMDMDTMEAKRASELVRRRKQRQESRESGGNKEWLAMFGALERSGASNAARTKDMREKYGHFMQLMSVLASDGAKVEDLHAVALFVYQQITSRSTHNDLNAKKKILESALGPIPKPQFREVKNLADDLCQNWVKAVVESEGPGKSKSKHRGSDAQRSAPTIVHEFGLHHSAIPFVSPFATQPLAPAAQLSENQDDMRAARLAAEVTAAAAGTEGGLGQPDRSTVAIDFDWLVRKSQASLTSSGLESSYDDAIDHAQKLQAMLASPISDEELQNDLFDLVGDFDFISELLQNRTRIAYLQMPTAEELAMPAVAKPPPRQTNQQTIRVGITLNTEYEKKMEKLRRKQERKALKGGADDLDFDDESLTHEAIIKARREAWQANLGGPKDLKAIAAALPADSGFESSGWGQKMSLPMGTNRKWSSCGSYEEVYVPMPRQGSSKRDPDELVQITELPDYARMVFRGIKTLNRLQSRVFETAFYSNENMLVCAPTGAGKTNVAMLTILREIGDHFIGGVLHKEEFKIVYVAPMKALAQEVAFKFNKALSALGVVVKELTGDTQLSKRDIQETQVLVVTPEKWDVVTRKSGDGALTSQVKLLIIDEVHLLNEDRGAVIETIVARTLRQVEASQSMIRIVGLSATLPNYKDVAEFLRVNAVTGLYYFDNSYRPVPLSQYFIGVKEKGHVQRLQKMNDICWLKTCASVENDDQVLIFVHSRNDTVRTAQTLV